MKKVFPALNVILILATMVSCICYYNLGGVKLKGLTSFGFVLIGVVNLIGFLKYRKKPLNFPLLMVFGLFLCMVGDIALNLHFITGTIIFAIGHIFYFASYCGISPFRWQDLLPCGIVFVISAAIILCYPNFDFGSSFMLWICLAYALIISCMVGKALSNFIRNRNWVTGLLSIGSILFYFSDLMLVFNVFANAADITDTLCLFTYYPAQCFLAYTIYQYTKKETQS